MLARPERFELPTAWFVARYSIQPELRAHGGGCGVSGRVDAGVKMMTMSATLPTAPPELALRDPAARAEARGHGSAQQRSKRFRGESERIRSEPGRSPRRFHRFRAERRRSRAPKSFLAFTGEGRGDHRLLGRFVERRQVGRKSLRDPNAARAQYLARHLRAAFRQALARPSTRPSTRLSSRMERIRRLSSGPVPSRFPNLRPRRSTIA